MRRGLGSRLLGLFAKQRPGRPEDRRQLQHLLDRAKGGQTDAQISIARIYYLGSGVERDPVEAATWYRRAAESGDALAQFELGTLLAGAAELAQDRGEAVTWWSRAAEQGYSDAQLWLGLLYRKGGAGPPNDAEALKWTLRAADQGHALAQHTLAGLLFELFGDREDCVDIRIEAFMWSCIADPKLWGENQVGAAKIRSAIAKKLTPDQIAEAQRRALEWRPMPSGFRSGR